MTTKNQPIRILHFADAHIDIANYGRHDPETALPVRVVDFLKSLDQVIETALAEKVDLVIFAGDAYKDRSPQPTFQREWGRRIMRLSQAGIPTILLVGNHDVSPAAGRAHTLHEFVTLEVPHIFVADRFHLWGPEELGVAVQVITVPWVSRSSLMTREETAGRTLAEILADIEERVAIAIESLIAQADPALPLILTAHASVEGAEYGSERTVMLGHELVLNRQLVHDRRLDYVALGHIHKHQALHRKGQHPPVVYSGSIERIDFGEARETKGYVLAEVCKGETTWRFMPLQTRRFVDLRVEARAAETFMQDVLSQLPDPAQIAHAICRVQLTYPEELEPFLDEKRIREQFDGVFSVQFLKHRLSGRRSRLGDAVAVEAMSPEELLAVYWRSIDVPEDEIDGLQKVAREILHAV
jgi:exonuclease SbcD